MTLINRRQTQRFSIRMNITVFTSTQAGGQLAFTTKNISESGLLVQSEATFNGKIGQHLDLLLYISKTSPSHNISFTAEIIHQDIHDHIHGLKIVNIKTEEKKKLDKFIKEISASHKAEL